MVLSCPFSSIVLQCLCSAADRAVSGARFLTGGVLPIVDLCHYCVCCMRSGVIRCTLLMVLYLTVCDSAGYTRCSGCTLVFLCAVSLQNLDRCTAGLLFLSQCSSETIADPVFDGVELAGFKSRANVFFYWPKLLYPYYSLLLFFPSSSFCL